MRSGLYFQPPVGEHPIPSDEAQGLLDPGQPQVMLLCARTSLQRNLRHVNRACDLLWQRRLVRVNDDRLGVFIQISSELLKLLNTLFCMS